VWLNPTFCSDDCRTPYPSQQPRPLHPAEHNPLPGQILGHEPGAFYNRLARTLGGYVEEVIAELARQGIVRADAEGQPVVRVCDASAIHGAAQIEVEADNLYG
jgi:hypothetical protein